MLSMQVCEVVAYLT